VQHCLVGSEMCIRDRALKALLPAARIGKRSGINGITDGQQLASGVHHRQPDSAGAQVNAQA
jgi:hypothetical protein